MDTDHALRENRVSVHPCRRAHDRRVGHALSPLPDAPRLSSVPTRATAAGEHAFCPLTGTGNCEMSDRHISGMVYDVAAVRDSHLDRLPHHTRPAEPRDHSRHGIRPVVVLARPMVHTVAPAEPRAARGPRARAAASRRPVTRPRPRSRRARARGRAPSGRGRPPVSRCRATKRLARPLGRVPIARRTRSSDIRFPYRRGLGHRAVGLNGGTHTRRQVDHDARRPSRCATASAKASRRRRPGR